MVDIITRAKLISFILGGLSSTVTWSTNTKSCKFNKEFKYFGANLHDVHIILCVEQDEYECKVNYLIRGTYFPQR